MQIDEFTPLFLELCYGCNKEFNDGQALVYFKHCSSFSKEAMKYAVVTAVRFHKPQFPRLTYVSELISLMNEYKQTFPAQKQLTEEILTPEQKEARRLHILHELKRIREEWQNKTTKKVKKA